MFKLGWKISLKSVARDLAIFLALLLLIEFWQARQLVHGQLPIALSSLRHLESSQPVRTFKESPLLLYVFAPWCGVCRVSASNLNLIDQHTTVIGLGVSWKDTEELSQFASEAKMEVPILIGTENEQDLLKVAAFPSYFLIDENGKIVRAWSGYTTSFGLFSRLLVVKAWLAIQTFME